MYNEKTVKATIGWVGVLNPDGTQAHVRAVEGWEKDAFDAALSFYKAPNKKKLPFALIPKSHASLRGTSSTDWPKAKGACEFHAIKSYVLNLFGISLSSEDDKWFQAHPLVEEAGTPMSDTLRVAQELIAPYHLKISRVRALPGVNLPGQLSEWPQVLGINPFGMMDGSTSNREFSASTGLPLSEVDQLFKFEYSEERLNPCVVCGVTSLSGKGYPGGHAEYAAPRSVHSSALHVLQFQMEREERVVWQREPVFPEAVAVETAEDKVVSVEFLSLYLSKAPSGEQFSTLCSSRSRGTGGYGFEYFNELSRSGVEYANDSGVEEDSTTWLGRMRTRIGSKESKAAAKTAQTQKTRLLLPGDKTKAIEATVSTFLFPHQPTGECFVCEQKSRLLSASHVCTECWSMLWSPYRCNQCPTEFSRQAPTDTGVQKSGDLFKVTGSCPKCARVFGLQVSPSDVMSTVIKNAYFGKRPSTDDRAIVSMIRRARVQ